MDIDDCNILKFFKIVFVSTKELIDEVGALEQVARVINIYKMYKRLILLAKENMKWSCVVFRTQL